MISKERLEELIQQNAIIWHDDWEEIKLDKNTCEIFKIKDMKGNYIGWFLYFNKYNYENHVNINELEEDVEKCKWERDFSVSYTVNLSLPTWEEFQKREDISFICPKSGHEIYLHNYNFIDEIHLDNSCNKSLEFEYTKDGYISACKKCLELFLGE